MTIFTLEGIAPVLDPDTWIAPDAVLAGRVVLAAGASVWFGAVLRGDIEEIALGAGSNVQDRAVLHTDLGFPLDIGADCTVGHGAILHGCTIGDGSLIGMGATVLNGARIGRHCLIGAGALVTEGTEIPDGHLAVGMPARVARPLRDDEIAGLGASAERYRINMRRFRDHLKPVY